MVLKIVNSQKLKQAAMSTLRLNDPKGKNAGIPPEKALAVAMAVVLPSSAMVAYEYEQLIFDSIEPAFPID